MKHLKIYTAAALAAVALAGSAQDALRSGYFLEGYTQRHMLNPAFAPERNYFYIPGLAGVNESLNSNIGLDAVIYHQDVAGRSQQTTFMNPDVDAEEALSRFKNTTKINERLNVPLLGAGWQAWGGYNTITLGVTAEVNASLSKDLFTFMKLGQTGDVTQYDFSDLGVAVNSFATLALGHSRQILPQLRVGGKVRFMLGAINGNLNVDQFDATLSDDQWSIRANGSLHITGGSGFHMYSQSHTHMHVEPGQGSLIDWGEIEYDSFSIAGFGMALDLGAVYQLTPELELSASLLDLGFISWSDVHNAYIPENATWTFYGFQNIALDKTDPNYEDNKLSQQFKNLGDQLQDAVEFRLDDTTGSRTTGIGATFMLGAQYKMPFYNKLRAGFLFTEHINGPWSWTEGRLSANVSPVKWFDAVLNYGLSTYGSALGWMANFHPKGCTVFLGCDYQFWKVNNCFIPIKRANIVASVGINFTFGSRLDHSLSALLPSF